MEKTTAKAVANWKNLVVQLSRFKKFEYFYKLRVYDVIYLQQ